MRREWTAEEDATALRFCQVYAPWRIARMLRRQGGHVRKRLQALGVEPIYYEKPRGIAHRALLRRELGPWLRPGFVIPTQSALAEMLGVSKAMAAYHLRIVLAEDGIATKMRRCPENGRNRMFVVERLAPPPADPQDERFADLFAERGK